MKIRYLLIGFLLGVLVTWWLEAEDSRSTTFTAPTPTKTPRHVRQTANSRTKDALVEIEGIGPAYEKALNALGIYTFDQLASQDAEVLASSLTARVSAERIRREGWIEQAKTRTN